MRIAVTSQSTRKRISKKMCNELATALIVRSVADRTKTDQVRRYMRHAFSQAVYNETWESTGRETETLEKEAIGEVQRAIGDENVSELGPASLELAVRAAYPLVVTGSLHDDRGTMDNLQPDRRKAEAVLDAMRHTVQGVHQLAQALRDSSADQQHIRAVDENGAIKKKLDGTSDLIISDAYLRQEFPPPGKARARTGGFTPTEQLRDRLADLGQAMDKLGDAFQAVQAVIGNDASPLVEVDGVDPQFCTIRRKLLSQIGDELNIWDRTFRRRHGTPAVPVLGKDIDDEDEDGQVDDADEAFAGTSPKGGA